MSEVLNRLVCASANGERAPVDGDDIREFIALYEGSPGEHPTPDGPFHLNEYLANRAFGGPEEGGWWYDTGRFVTCHGAYGTVAEATAARDAKANWLADRRAGTARPVLGALHGMARASHRAARRRRLPPPRGRATSKGRPDGGDACASPPFAVPAVPNPSTFGPLARASPDALAPRRRQEAEAWPVSGRPPQGQRSLFMPRPLHPFERAAS